MKLGGVHAALGTVAFLGIAGALGGCGEDDLTFVAGRRPVGELNGGGAGNTDEAGGGAGTAAGSAGRASAEKMDASSRGGTSDTDATGGGGTLDRGTGGTEARPDADLADASDAAPMVDRADGAGDGGRDANEASIAPRDSGPTNVVFSFDADGDFTAWSTLNDIDGLSPGGLLLPVSDEAVPGHLPARALGWTATFTSYQTSVRAFALFSRAPDWTGRTALHFTVKIVSGLSSLRGFQIYFQAGGPGFASRYLDEQPIGDIADSASFHDISVPLTNTTITASVTFIGFVLSAVSRPAGAGIIPPPAVVEIDNIWLE